MTSSNALPQDPHPDPTPTPVQAPTGTGSNDPAATEPPADLVIIEVTKETAPPPDAPVNEWLEIRSSTIHGRGGFARCLIPAGTRIVEYVGERVDKAESARRCENGNPYVFTINDEWDIDGDVAWNPARFLNHSCGPNCEAQQEDDRIWIVTLRPIEPGEELTFNYGYDLTTWREYPCECGAPNCLGFIVAEEYWAEVTRELAADKAKQPPP